MCEYNTYLGLLRLLQRSAHHVCGRQDSHRFQHGLLERQLLNAR
jgi:hypothetical protein